jgi:undecaprenyl-diphosphatase
MNSVVAQDSPAGNPGADVPGPAAPQRRAARRLWLAGFVCAVLSVIGWETVYVLLGSNFHCVAPGQAYRSAQPSAAWLRQAMARDGIQSVINLRGDGNDAPWYVSERQAVLDHGGCFANVMLSAAFAPHQRDLRLLVHTLDAAPKPVLFHCRAGADRSGLAAVIYLLLYTDTPMPEARRQLSWRYGHFAGGRSACLQNVLDQYEDWLTSQQAAHQPERLRQWIMQVYRKAA